MIRALVYTSGPYHADTPAGIRENIRCAEAVAIQLWNEGFGALCPHLNSQHFELWCPDVPQERWLAADLRMLDSCDAILMIGDWMNSRGSKVELDHATAQGIRIFTDIDRLLDYYPVRAE